MSDQKITVDVVGCARCHGNGHEDLTFVPLTYPVWFDLDGRRESLTHWAPCPENGEPVLLAIVSLGTDATDRPAETP